MSLGRSVSRSGGFLLDLAVLSLLPCRCHFFSNLLEPASALLKHGAAPRPAGQSRLLLGVCGMDDSVEDEHQHLVRAS